MSHPAPCYRVPPELWRLVFSQFATTTTTTTHDAVDHVPFEPPQEMRETSAYIERVARCRETCVALTRVCRLWRLIVAEFLYADVRIANVWSLHSLMRGLERSRADGLGGFGRHVRRLELPRLQMNGSSSRRAAMTNRPSAPTIHLADVFRYTPRLEVFVRPPLHLDEEDMHFWASLIAAPLGSARGHLLPNLRRLEWHETELDNRIYGSRNTARLFELIANAPALSYFFLSSDHPEILSTLGLFPSLRTLRVARAHYHSHSNKIPTGPAPLAFPRLRTLILQSALPSALLPWLSAVGPRLHTIELAFAPQVVFSSGQMQRILSRCPALVELAFHLGAPEISALPPSPAPPTSASGFGRQGTNQFTTHPTLRRLRLRLSPEEWYPYKHVLRSQFAIIEGPSFPCLREIVLHDETRSLVRREAGPPFLRAMMRRGCVVQYEGGESVIC
ncbi:hypothetical protein FB45DRAFT_524643 [Roridomyces roridus]|uniref:F-box domain-containing protein n=1 Tax=Roridomyces roridus TaxID=1738132 RepID=A0AAD7AZC5_9AGAR|nr:hypothetical protein FB45DRAFT_524643 [Roridomyces roridus]